MLCELCGFLIALKLSLDLAVRSALQAVRSSGCINLDSGLLLHLQMNSVIKLCIASAQQTCDSRIEVKIKMRGIVFSKPFLTLHFEF